MAGTQYMRVRLNTWQDEEHYGREWSRANPAPVGWVSCDIAWYVETRRPFPSVRDASRAWGWPSLEKVARVIREEVQLQASWEQRPERRRGITAMLEEWASKEPKAASTARRAPQRRTGAEQHPPFARNEIRTPDHGETPIVDGAAEHEANRSRTAAEHKANHARGPLQDPASASASASAGSLSATAGAAAASTDPPAEGVKTPPAPADRPPKPRKSPGYTEAIAAFDEEHRSIRGTKYPWVFTGRESDAARVKTWLQAAQVATDRPGEGVARIRGAARAYLRAVEAGAAWPHGEPASTRHFTREIARWLQVDPEAQPTGPPGGASPPRGSKTSRVDAALAEAQRRLAERRSSSSNHTKETDLAIP